jgi:hypothetical protein
MVGQPLLLDVAPDTARIEVRRPDDGRSVIEGEQLVERRQVRFAVTDEPGFYQIANVAADPSGADGRGESAFAVNLDPRGSDLTRAPLEQLLGNDQAAAIANAAPATSHRRRVELWHAVAAALLLFLLVESVLVWRR